MSCCGDRLDTSEQIRDAVREQYAKTASGQTGCCGPSVSTSSGCCGTAPSATQTAKHLGYTDEELAHIPNDANLGLGCGNPTALDTLKPGETVVDLGSGAGMDVFLAAKQVGPEGRVIGVDMTEEMVAKARKNAAQVGAANVEFRLGLIESLPVESETVDAIISNCVINLSPEKSMVFAEAFRVLKPGGRLMVSDIVLDELLPAAIEKSVAAYTGCIAGASLRDDYLNMMTQAGFTDIKVVKDVSAEGLVTPQSPMVKEAMAELGVTLDDIRQVMKAVRSLGIFAIKH